jgi:hypothetical protein
MQNTISKAETYARSLKGASVEYKESKLYEKYGASLGIETCKRIAQTF